MDIQYCRLCKQPVNNDDKLLELIQENISLRQQLAEQPNVDVLVEALKHADEFIRNGVEFGYIRMPDDDLKGIDSAHDTPKIIAKALATYQAKKE